MNTHDPSYKLLFSHPQMVRDLLIGFVNEPWVADLDFDTLEQVSGSYISDDLRDREDDLLWRVRLRDYAPHLRYLLLDEGAIDESTPWALKNLVAALFRLEKSRWPQPLQAALTALTHWLDAPEQASLRRAFTVWIKRVLIPARLPGINFPELGDLLEIKTMLAESVLDWTQEWKQQGLEQGLQKGRLEGETSLLERQFIKRFGSLTEETRARLRASSSEQRQLWAERIFDALNLEDVFTDD